MSRSRKLEAAFAELLGIAWRRSRHFLSNFHGEIAMSGFDGQFSSESQICVISRPLFGPIGVGTVPNGLWVKN
jgi:hypothetical protein